MNTPRKQPRQQRSRVTVSYILEAAAQLFERDGYTATTTNHIAERAGVSIGSIYQYFPNKDALMVALAEQHLNEAHEAVNHIFDRVSDVGPSLRGTLSALIHGVAVLHIEQPKLHRLLFGQTPRSPELVALFRAGEQRIASRLAEELRRFKAGGPNPEFNALLAVQGIEAQIHGAMLDTTSADAHSEVIEIVTDLWCRALSEPWPTED